MRKLSSNYSGFTIIELMVVITVVVAISVVALSNIRTIRAQNRDATRKQDVNAIYFQLESFHESNGYYPQIPTAQILKGINPVSLTDSNNKAINQPGGAYTYTPIGCKELKCTSYTLSAELEREAIFVKQSLIK